VSAPVGAAGAVVSCASGPEAEAPSPSPRARLAVASGWSRSHLSFDGDDARFDKASVVATSDLYTGKFTVTLGAGGLFAGELVTDRGAYDVEPGFLGVLGLGWRVLAEEEAIPYVVLAATLGVTNARTARASDRGGYLGVDFRFGATVGKTFFGWLSPYASARVFGGPVVWSEGRESRLGTDRYHVQGALGAVFILPEGLDLFVEGSPGAEQGGFGGLGWRY
jgi:hypothetical protein